MSEAAVRVVKIGGSLFDYPDLATAWGEWVAREPEMMTVIIAGGGPYADLVRQWDQRFSLSEETAHWMCVASMNVTAALLHQRLPAVHLLDDWQALRERVASSKSGSDGFFGRIIPEKRRAKLAGGFVAADLGRE